ncbi:hypothetical protein BV401_22340 [Streptomyces malaysiensis subsp. malaysiensis]|uniref:Uncharacterized protein n=1 Tax=Streptomyces autolyticus TaxID=75293 RepID=A0ABM6HFG7_9ACTN|nr:hypothetical protein BV401_22340 [Streptomyces autolyticus]
MLEGKICTVLSIRQFHFPAPLDLAQTNLGVDLLRSLWALSEMEYGLRVLSRELLLLFRKSSYPFCKPLYFITLV